MVENWYLMPSSLGVIGDRVFWKAIKDKGLSRAHRANATVNFRTNYRGHYERFGKTPPRGAKHVHIQVTPDGRFVSANVEIDQGEREMAKKVLAESKRSPTVSLCMIVKNEEHNLDACLGPLAGLFHEIIVVDTGSSDHTKEAAERHGAKVIDF